MRVVAALVLTGVLFLPSVTLAQFSSPNDALTLSFSPTYPRPYDQVTVTVESTLFNLATSDIAISVDGAIIEEGARSATFRAGGPGTRSVVRASATTLEGTKAAQTTLRPAEVSLIVEPSSSAHPFYEGGLLTPSEGRVRIVALSDLRSAPGTRLSESNISYTWKVDDRILTAESGYGKNVLVATAPPRYRNANITVTAVSRDQTIVAESSVTVAPVDPVLRIYAMDPLSGTDFTTALLETFSFRENEVGFKSVGYFFKDIPAFSWRLNGAMSGTQDALTVRSSGGSGSAILSAEASLEGVFADDAVTLRFESGRTSNVFGF